MNDSELILQYLVGELDAAAARDFEERLQNDPAFAETFRLYQSVEKEMQLSDDEATLQSELAALSTKHFITSSTTGKTAVIQFNRKWLWVAAAAAACLLIGLFIYKPWQPAPLTLAEVYQRHAIPEELPLSTRGTATDSLQQAAARQYNNKQYSAALPLLEKLVQADSTNTQWKMAFCVSALQTDLFERATTGFRELANGSSIYKYDALIWEALVSVKQNKKEEAVRLLKQVPATVTAGKEAQKILKELGDEAK